MTTPNSFGSHLRQFREAVELTQDQLATAAGLSRTAVNRYEGGRHDPTWPVVLKLCEVLGKRPNDFAPVPSRKRKKAK